MDYQTSCMNGTDAERVRAQPDRADDIKHQMEVQTAVEELGAQLQVGAQWAGLLLLCCGKVMPTLRHALRPAGNEHLDSHQRAGSACGRQLWACCKEPSASEAACR